MKINLTQEKILELVLEHKIIINDIEKPDREEFLKHYANPLLNQTFKIKDFKCLESLIENEDIQKYFINEIKLFNNLADISYLEKLPKDNIVSNFILSMSRQNYEEKKDFFQKIVPMIMKNKEEMKKFFSIRIGENLSAFPSGQPIGLFFLRVLDEGIENLLDENIISINLFSPTTKDTIAHYLCQYSFANSKSIIERFSDINIALKDKNSVNHTPIDKMMNDLRERNIQILEYLFTEKLNLQLYKKEFINYIIKGSNILKNQQTKPVLRERIFNTFKVLFDLQQLQENEDLKQEIAKNLASKATTEIQYLWLSAKLPTKGIEIKKMKI